MLKVYTAEWCWHCVKTIEYLKKNNIEFDCLDIEKQDRHIVDKIVEVNGGVDWVVPTLEFNGRWREGKVFNKKGLAADLKELGLILTPP